MSSSSTSHNKNIIASHYQIAQKIGEGSFGIIFKGYDLLRDNEPVAIKFESRKSEAPQLKDEFKAYKILNNSVNEYVKYYNQQQQQQQKFQGSSLGQLSSGSNKEKENALPDQKDNIQESSTTHHQSASNTIQTHHSKDNNSNNYNHSHIEQHHYLSIEGIPRVYYFGQEGYYNILIIQLLGPSLEDLFEWCGRRFSVKTVAQVAKQMIKRIQFVHENDLIYRDIKPDNFLIGSESQKDNIIYLVDFGMIKQYRNPITKQHIPYRERKSLSGTARYMSINTHLGREQSRRDDLESLGHVFLYFLKGELPWQGLKAQTNKLKYEKIGEKKQSTPISELCYKLPIQFAKYLSYVRNLRFEEEPNYIYLIQLMDDCLHEIGSIDDGYYDWMALNDGKGWSWNKNKKTNLNGYGSNQRNVSNTNVQNSNSHNNNNNASASTSNAYNRASSSTHPNQQQQQQLQYQQQQLQQQQQQQQLQQQQQQHSRSMKLMPSGGRQPQRGQVVNETSHLLGSSGQPDYRYYNQQQLQQQQQMYDGMEDEEEEGYYITKILKSIFCCF